MSIEVFQKEISKSSTVLYQHASSTIPILTVLDRNKFQSTNKAPQGNINWFKLRMLSL